MPRVTGDVGVSHNTDAVAQAVTVVLAADLADKDHPVNQYHLSGKRKGAMFLTEDLDIAIAAGRAPTDDWIIVGDTAITPA